MSQSENNFMNMRPSGEEKPRDSEVSCLEKPGKIRTNVHSIMSIIRDWRWYQSHPDASILHDLKIAVLNGAFFRDKEAYV